MARLERVHVHFCAARVASARAVVWVLVLSMFSFVAGCSGKSHDPSYDVGRVGSALTLGAQTYTVTLSTPANVDV